MDLAQLEFLVGGLGRIQDAEDERDLILGTVDPTLVKITKIAKRLSYRGRCGLILDQARTSQCVTHGVASVKTFQERRDHRRTYTFNPARLYALCKQVDGIPDLEGTYTRVALKLVNKIGYGRLGKEWDLDSASYKIETYARVTSLDETFAALKTYGPIVGGVTWYPEWSRPEGNILRTPPSVLRYSGGHLMAMIGYDTTTKLIEWQNSWGLSWGDQGHCFMTFDEYERQLYDRRFSADIWSMLDVIV